MIAPADRSVELDPETARLREGALEKLGAAGFQPPSQGELAADLGVSGKVLQRVLQLLVDEGEVVHLGADLFIAGGPHAKAKQAVLENCQRNGELVIPELRDVLGTTRKYLIPLLEHFDSVGMTARRGGTRVLKK